MIESTLEIPKRKADTQSEDEKLLDSQPKMLSEECNFHETSPGEYDPLSANKPIHKVAPEIYKFVDNAEEEELKEYDDFSRYMNLLDFFISKLRKHKISQML
jgi:hypothetical protein